MQQSRPAVLATVVTACALLTACAGSAGSATTVDTAPAPQQIMTASGQSIRLGTTSSIVAVSEAIRIGADSAYGLLLKVYGDLQIPTTTLDSRQHTAGNPALKIRRRLGGVSLIKYLDCGHKDGNPNADSYDVVLHVVTAVSGAAEGSSVLSTRVDGVATHPVFGSQAVCSTTGELGKNQQPSSFRTTGYRFIGEFPLQGSGPLPPLGCYLFAPCQRMHTVCERPFPYTSVLSLVSRSHANYHSRLAPNRVLARCWQRVWPFEGTPE